MGELRKTVLFIVEGSSDKTALEKIFKKIYKNQHAIEFRFTDGDISSDINVTTKTVEDRIYDIIDKFIKDKKLKKSDLYQIVQVLDMDGAYIPDSAITKGESPDLEYSTSGIKCSDVAKAIARNRHKKSIMDFLISMKEIHGIPYELFFMSCNLDHALYDEINLRKENKQDFADAFYEKFIDKELKFIDFLKDDVVNGVPDSFPVSWKYIREDLHSVERHTNLHIYFESHPRIDGLF